MKHKLKTKDKTGFVGVFSDVSMLRKLERERVGLEQTRREEAEHNRQLQEHFIDGKFWYSESLQY